jgi:hypothetical protein
MTLAPSLVEQRVALRGQLHVQRLEVAEQLFASRAGGRFPRSITMRVLLHQPELAGRLVSLIFAGRSSGSMSAFLLGIQVLRAVRMSRAEQTDRAPARLMSGHPPPDTQE